MGVKVRVVRAAANIGGGTQDFTVSGFGTPKAALFYVSKAIADNSDNAPAFLCVGATDGTNERSSAAVATSDGARAHGFAKSNDEVCIVLFGGGGTGTAQTFAEFTSWVTDGVRITWDDVPPDAYIITCVLFGGTDLTAKVGDLDGNPDVNEPSATTSVGFQADCLFTFCTDGFFQQYESAEIENGTISLGHVVNGGSITQNAMAWCADDAPTTVTTTAAIKDNRCVMALDETGHKVSQEVTAFSSTGFTITTRDSSAELGVGYLALKFNSASTVETRIVDTPTGTGNANYSTDSDPEFVSFLQTHLTALGFIDTTDTDSGAIGVGVGDQTLVDGSLAIRHQTGDATIVDGFSLSDVKIANLDLYNGTSAFVATLNSVASSQAQLNFTTTRAAARKWGFLSIGQSASTSPIAGTVACTSTASATLTGKGALAGSATVTATGAATVTAKGAVAGNATGTATASATLTARGAVAGAATGTGTVSATLTATGTIAGAATGTATASATVTAVGAVAGAATGTVAASTVIQGLAPIAGVTTGIVTGSATASAVGAIVGTSTGTAIASATIIAIGALAGDSACSGTASSTLTDTGSLAGNAIGTATPFATLTGAGALDGSTTGTATVSATIQGLAPIACAATGTATASATLIAVASIEGSTTGAGAGSATLTGTGALSGVLACAATVVATLVGIGALLATTTGTVVASATFTGALAGTSSNTATATATITGNGALAGNSGWACTASGTLLGTGVALAESFSAPFYARLAATAKRLIEAKGRTVTLFKSNTTPATLGQPWLGPNTSSLPASGQGGDSLTALAVFVPARGTSFGSDAAARAGTLLEDVEQFALIASTSMPANTDLTLYESIDDGAHIWRIVFAGELKPGATSLIWEVGVKR